MTPKRLCILLLVLVAVGAAFPQNEEIPVEDDNQFPPENPAEEDTIVGSGDGSPDDQLTLTTIEVTPAPQLEEVQPSSTIVDHNIILENEESSCPEPCMCHTEGTSEDYVVDCSGHDLTDLPSPISIKTTILKIQNNKLTEIPKSVSVLKNLKVLNADNNSIMDLAHGSISELPELKTLNLANNRLIEFPKDLRNSFTLEKLEELDLGGNDMRTELKPETFSNFLALRKLVLPTSTPELLEEICYSLKNSLETVCTANCNEESYDCLDAPQKLDDDFIEATLPGAIAFGPNGDIDPKEAINQEENNDNDDTLIRIQDNGISATTDYSIKDFDSPSDLSTNMPQSETEEEVQEQITPVKTKSMLIDPPQDDSTKAEEDVKIGAATASNGGGVDKSVIGMIVAGMVVIVAGITIKKNWSSITRRGSSPRGNANGNTVVNTNGTTPEEVPLQEKQDKSPV